MWKQAKIFLIGFITAIGGVLLFIIAGRNSKTSNTKQSDLDRNNTRIRQGIDRLRDINNRERDRIKQEREQLKRERARAKADRKIIASARRTVSDIIRDGKTDND